MIVCHCHVIYLVGVVLQVCHEAAGQEAHQAEERRGSGPEREEHAGQSQQSVCGELVLRLPDVRQAVLHPGPHEWRGSALPPHPTWHLHGGRGVCVVCV